MVTTNLKNIPAEEADLEFIYIEHAGWLFIHLKTKDLNLMIPIEPKRVDEIRETIKK